MRQGGVFRRRERMQVDKGTEVDTGRQGQGCTSVIRAPNLGVFRPSEFTGAGRGV